MLQNITRRCRTTKPSLNRCRTAENPEPLQNGRNNLTRCRTASSLLQNSGNSMGVFAETYGALQNAHHEQFLREKRIRCRTKKYSPRTDPMNIHSLLPHRRIQPSHFKREDDSEADNMKGLVTTLSTFLKAIAPADVRRTLLYTNFLSSLASLLMTFYLVVKKGSKLTYALVSVNVINFITSTLLCAGIGEEAVQEVVENLEAVPEILTGNLTPNLTPKFRTVPSHFWQGHLRDEMTVSPAEYELLLECAKRETLNGTIIRQIAASISTMMTLPANQKPIKTTDAVRNAWDDFRYPDWFLAAFWDIDDNLMSSLRFIKNAISRERSNSYGQDTSNVDLTVREMLLKGWFKNMNDGRISDPKEFQFLAKVLDMTAPSPLTILQLARKMNITLPVLSGEWTEEDLRWPDWFLGLYTDACEEAIQELREVEAGSSSDNSYDDPKPGPSKINPAEFTVESGKDFWQFFTMIGYRIVAIFVYIFDVITTKSKFSIAGLLSTLRLTKQLKEESNDLQELYCLLTGATSPKQEFDTKITQYIADFNEFMETPTFEFAKDPMLVTRMKTKVEQFLSWYNACNKDQRADLQPAYTLYGVVNARIAQYYQSDIKNLSRQEPFLVVLGGSGGIGKTQLARHLMLKTCKDILKVNPLEHIAEITPDDKYWPPLGGQTVALFDDAATVKDLKDDLLFKNLKGICAPTLFNAPGADVPHKINPVNFKVIFCTTNTPIDTIIERITTMYDISSIGAYMRRMIYVNCEWNPARGKHNPDEPWNNKFDSTNYSHIKMMLRSFAHSGPNKGKMTDNRPIDIPHLLELIAEKEAHYSRDFAQWLMKMSMQTQNSISHFSVLLHGRAGQGKTFVALDLVKKLGKTLHMPLVFVSSLVDLQKVNFKQKCILIMDDIIRESMSADEENILMDLYNARLPRGSLIVSTTNKSPSYSLPTLTWLGILHNRTVKFLNEGLPRRLGYQGHVNKSHFPGNGIEIRCSNMRYYQKTGDTSIIFTELMEVCTNHIPATAISVLLFSLMIWLYPVILLPTLTILCGIILFYCRSIEEEIDFEDMTDIIARKFVEYTTANNGISISYVDHLENFDDYNLEIISHDSAAFMKFETLRDLDQHIFVDRTLYHNSQESWKIFMSPLLLREMQRNPERYAIRNIDFTEDSVISLVKRYVTAFNNVGIKPYIRATFDDLGTYVYRGDVLKIMARSTNPFEDDYDEPQILLHNGVFSVYFVDRWYTIKQIDSFSLQDYIDSGMSTKESRILYDFKHSQAFNSHPFVIEARIKASKDHLKFIALSRAKYLKDSFLGFIKHPLGMICLMLVGIFTAVVIGSYVRNMFRTEGKTHSRRQKSKKPVSSEDSDSETTDDEELQRKKGKKGSPKVKSWDTDDDKRKQRKKGKKGSPKVKSWDTDDDKRKTQAREDVLTKRDMNDFVAFKPYFNDAFKSARRNLTMMYTSPTTGPILDSEPSQQLCYGLFIKQNLLVTVGHITDVKGCIFTGADEFQGYHRCIKIYQYPERDLSVWVVPTLKHQFKDISKLFVSSKHLFEDDAYNAVLQRFAPGKVEEFHSSEFQFMPGPDYFPGQNGNLKMYGAMTYATVGVRVSDGGDCGLPYYYAERIPLLTNKIIGIHCMGNIDGYATAGIAAVIFAEDIAVWNTKCQQAMQTKQWNWIDRDLGLVCCPWMPLNDDYAIEPSDHPLADKHDVLWGPECESTQETFVSEFEKYTELNPHFTGTVLKHSGVWLFGSVHHSHTQFVHDVDLVEADPRPWCTVPAKDMPRHETDGTGPGLSIIVDIASSSLRKYMKKYKKYGSEFRVRAHRYKSTSQGKYMLRMEFLTLAPENEQIKQTKYCEMLENDPQEDILVPFPSHYGDPIHVTPEVHAVLNGAVLNKERGKLEDMPYEAIENNATVKVIGSFSQSKSHIPTNHYHLSPFSKIAEEFIPIEKKPCVYDLTLIPDDVKAKFVKDNYGVPSQLATLSVSWAHPVYSNRQQLAKISEQFETKIKAYYSGLRLLTDKEVLAGVKLPDKYARFLEGMELDTSIGFTMKQLFYVSKKTDVIGVTEKGDYYWQNNTASEYLQGQFEIAKELSGQGKKYLSVFTELLKMEKLKLAKIYRGRTFVAQDILGVLMERRNLGILCARAYGTDPECGIGTDPVKDFNRIYVKLIKHPNLWAGDYTNFDRNTPAIVQLEITRLLAKNNPHMANEINSTMRTNIERIQVCGTTLAEVFGGMPSGCFSTAPLNSLNNEYLMYASFYYLANEYNLDNSWKAYNSNVERMYYGDDVIISVSDLYKDAFTRTNVSRILKSHFGMTLDSSAKDGSESTFDNFETASWISRFFRKVGKYPFRAGALKKISIGANFHYVSSTSLEHLGGLMEKAQWEAAFWEPEYFHLIQKAIRACCNKNHNLLKYVNVRSMESIHKEAYEMAGLNIVKKQDIPTTSWADEVEEEFPLEEIRGLLYKNISDNRDGSSINQPTFFDKYLFKQKYFRHVVSPICRNREDLIKMSSTYAQRLNDLFTEGVISKPEIDYTSTGPDDHKLWFCNISTRVEKTQKLITGQGTGTTKKEAKEEASYEIVSQVDTDQKKLQLRKSLKLEAILKSLHSFKLEMNVSAGVVNKTPGAPMVQADVNVVADSGLYTNTAAPSPAKILNSTGIALDNPAGSGAPFNKHVSVYNIYQRWESKNTVISPAMASGVEVLRLSLNPSELPEMISSYVSFHQSFVPELDITVAIAGANGTIGWLACGWVKDASPGKSYTLSDLQQVSMEETNMNGTQVIRIKLTDVRRTGLYRLTENDPEPYPGVIFMIDQAVTNVQRNDSVNYPVRVQVRLGSGCVLMEPFNLPKNGPNNQVFNLGSYFYDSNVDLLIGSSAVTDIGDDLLEFTDSGYLTKDFIPTFNGANFLYADFTETANVGNKYIQCLTTEPTIPAKYLSDIIDAYGRSGLGTIASIGCRPKKMWFAYGKVSAQDPAGTWYSQTPTIIGTSVTVPEKKIYFGAFCYLFNKMYIQPTGAIAELSLSYAINDVNDTVKLMVYQNCLTDVVTQDLVDASPGFVTTYYVKATWFSNPKAGVVGDDFDTPYAAKDSVAGATTTDTAPMPRIWTFTGNSQPSTNLPAGLKELAFVRSGTSSTQSGDTPFVPLYKPVIRNAFTALNEILSENSWTILKGDLYVAGLNRGQIGYQKGMMFVRTDDFKKILSAIGNDVKIRNLAPLDSIQGLAAFNTTGYSSWTTNTVGFVRRQIDFSAFKRESAIAGGMIAGLGSGISDWSKQLFQSAMLDKLNKANMALQGANNDAIAERQRLAFQRQLELTGYQGDSAQHGTRYPGFVGPRIQEESSDSHVFDNMSNQLGREFVYSSEFTPQTHNPFATVSKISDSQPDMTEFHVNPIYVAPKRYVNNPTGNASFLDNLIPNHSAPGVEPINSALSKDNGIENTRFVQHQPTNENGDVEPTEKVQPSSGPKVSDAK